MLGGCDSSLATSLLVARFQMLNDAIFAEGGVRAGSTFSRIRSAFVANALTERIWPVLAPVTLSFETIATKDVGTTSAMDGFVKMTILAALALKVVFVVPVTSLIGTPRHDCANVIGGARETLYRST